MVSDMLEVKIKADRLQGVVKAMSAILSESIFEFDKDGMVSKAVDESNACMVEIEIPKEVFSEYNLEDTKIGIGLDRFVDIIGMAEKDDDITLYLDEDTHKLDILVGKMSYTLSLLDPTSIRPSPNLPTMELPSSSKISGSALKRMVKAALMVNDVFTLGVSDKTFYMEASGDLDDVRLELLADDTTFIRDADASSAYSLDYFAYIIKGIGSTEHVIINIGTDLPIIMEFSPYENCFATYVLAPRIRGES